MGESKRETYALVGEQVRRRPSAIDQDNISCTDPTEKPTVAAPMSMKCTELGLSLLAAASALESRTQSREAHSSLGYR
jgi:hypothetical protein